MDVDKKPCEDNTASTQSSTVNRTAEEEPEPERIVKVSDNFSLVFLIHLFTYLFY